PRGARTGRVHRGMSLINDALKRAKQAQGQTPAPTAPVPQLRPVEPVVAASHASRLAMPGITIAVIGIALFLAWRLVHTNSSVRPGVVVPQVPAVANAAPASRSEEHTSELQSRGHLVCRLLLEKKKRRSYRIYSESAYATWR